MPSIDRQVGASSDDCRVRWNGSSWEIDTSSVQQNAGYRASDRFKEGGGMRFTNIAIPKGSTINSAYITITCRTARSDTVVRSKVRGEDADNPSAFSDYTDYSGRPRTSTEVNWDNIPAWTGDTEYNSPDISTIVQEIIDREGWSSGNAIVIFWDDHDDRSDHNDYAHRMGQSYDGSASQAPKLHIEYTPLAAGGARSHAYIMG